MSEKTLKTFGSVQPADSETVQKLPEAMRTGDLRGFWFKGEIIASAPGKYSSILVFGENRYQVIHVFPWSNFGRGYTQGVCVSEVIA